MKYLWGKGCEEPLILLENFNINNENIKIFSKGVMRIDLGNGITAVKFNTKEEEYLNLISGNKNKLLNIIGYCTINEWNFNKYPQIRIVDYEIKKEDNK